MTCTDSPFHLGAFISTFMVVASIAVGLSILAQLIESTLELEWVRYLIRRYREKRDVR
jgi:hypothetical protein